MFWASGKKPSTITPDRSPAHVASSSIEAKFCSRRKNENWRRERVRHQQKHHACITGNEEFEVIN
jgi:hypothetical protein